jgi:hypothetical protein
MESRERQYATHHKIVVETKLRYLCSVSELSWLIVPQWDIQALLDIVAREMEIRARQVPTLIFHSVFKAGSVWRVLAVEVI